MTNPSLLFDTIPRRDYLHFWSDDTFEPQQVVRFLNLSKADVAKVAGVAQSSVRFDQKTPRDVIQRFMEIATICGLVAQFFDGNTAKTSLWFRTKNPLLGNLTPRDMIRFGRYEKLRRFVMEALENNVVRRNAGAKRPEGELPSPTS